MKPVANVDEVALDGGGVSHSLEIGRYQREAVAIRAYDPIYPMVAAAVSDCLRSALHDVAVEHVGSTSVPGCDGKGVLDFAVLYREGRLEAARDALDRLGFQRQSGRDPFPEGRPLRVAAVSLGGVTLRVHAHVIAHGSDEHGELVFFRERLRADADLLAAYVAEKRDIVARGISDGTEYAGAKAAFIQRALNARRR
jgi:GrpB-like predicted nucleotidyltransferase (UPF0157 family)